MKNLFLPLFSFIFFMWFAVLYCYSFLYYYKVDRIVLTLTHKYHHPMYRAVDHYCKFANDIFFSVFDGLLI